MTDTYTPRNARRLKSCGYLRHEPILCQSSSICFWRLTLSIAHESEMHQSFRETGERAFICIHLNRWDQQWIPSEMSTSGDAVFITSAVIKDAIYRMDPWKASAQSLQAYSVGTNTVMCYCSQFLHSSEIRIHSSDS